MPEIDYDYCKGRTYKGFQTYLSEFGDGNIVEMDTVHGNRISGKVMLTMIFLCFSLMLIFLLEKCRQKWIGEVFDGLAKFLGL